MKRRRFLATGVAAGIAGLAGCLDGAGDDSPTDESESFDSMPQIDDPPDAVYLPSHQDGMVPLETQMVGEFAVSPMVSIPHFFWIVETGIGEGYSLERVDPPDGDSVHLMATVWDPETEVVLPIDAGLSIDVEQDGDLVDSRTPWPMLSQGMGFHFGDNYELDGDGTYTATISTGSMDDVRLTGEMAGRFGASETVTVQFEMDADRRQTLVESAELFEEDRWGSRDAVPPMNHGGHGGDNHDANGDHDGDHSMPYSALPAPETLAGTLLGTPTFDDAVYATTLVDAGSRFVEDGREYLAISPRTPYNSCVLPGMSLSVAIDRDGERADLGTAQPTLDHELEFHYGLPVEALQNGDTIALSIETIPQASRHQGYETAFTRIGDLELEVADL